MRLNIIIGGKAGQGINKISEIVSKTMASYGYFTFNYRDYPSIIRGGHNFNLLSISDEKIESHESKVDGIVAMDDKTAELHKGELKKGGFIIQPDAFVDAAAPDAPRTSKSSDGAFGAGKKELFDFGRNLNVALAGALMKILGFDQKTLLEIIRNEFKNEEAVSAAEKGFESEKKKFELKNLKNKITIATGSKGVVDGAINSKIDLYMGYPMTPSTTVLQELASRETKEGFMVFQNENEIAVANAALGASFAGAKVMVGTSGGGYDLMTEALSLQGISGVPLVVYLASRKGPGTGIPTYTGQDDLMVALHGGHGEFPRVVVAPGNPTEAAEKTNEAFYLSQKFGALSIILSDKHLAESEFSTDEKIKKPLEIKVMHKVPGEGIVRATSYEHDKNGVSTESAEIAEKNGKERLKRYETLKKECKKFEMIKIHGNKASKNLIISWGSTRGAIIDAIKGLDFKFLQVLYIKPMSDEIKKEILKAKNVILIENNLTGLLGRVIREKTGIKIENRILKFDGRPFTSDELREEILKVK